MSATRKNDATPTDRDTLEREAAVMPPLLKYGMVVVLLQCAAMFAYIISLLVSQFGGQSTSVIESQSAAAGYVSLGTAVFLAIIFGFIAYAAVSTLRGKPMAQGGILLIEAILVGVAIYMFRGGVPMLATATLITAIFGLIALLHPDTRRFEEARYALKNERR
ncbi:hypothetical protein M5J20_07080 [Corynebacterium sp. TA-R-1]|uniref:Uncharacterized protein n=1 Tax=Corynebacterium stercoris TaxID=2943490 RepID=A0ABT1G2A3_9CORY|nr:hypothetical protein [Corynebacterium stercoris]MCP1387952.1 hypothetical protein [Corynebacterium stercoris]